MRYLMNAAVIPNPGDYVYRVITESQAREWLKDGDWVSRIGYEATADHIEQLCGIRPKISRERVQFEIGDEALVVRLTYRVQDPAAKATHRPGPDDWEYGLLARDG